LQQHFVLLENIEHGAEIDAPAGLAAVGPLVAVIDSQFEANLAQDAAHLHVSPVAAIAILCRQVGKFLVVLHLEAFQAGNQAQIPRVDIVARTLDRDREMAGVRFVRRPADLDVPVEHHARRAPVVDRVRKHVAVHEQAVGLAGKECAPFTVRVTQPECRLARVDARAEQVKLELEVKRGAAAARGQFALHAETRLLDADARLSVRAAGAVDADLRRAKRVIPGRIESPADVRDEVGLREAINLE
jgi:hypothetical protein